MNQETKQQVKEVWKLSTPAIFSQLAAVAMTYIDTAMVGNLGADATAGVGLVAPVMWLMNGVTCGIATGFSVQIAHHVGAGEDEKARNVYLYGICACLVIGAVLGLMVSLLAFVLPEWMGAEPEVCEQARLYLLVSGVSLLLIQPYWLCTLGLQCCGDMKTPMVICVATCLLDIGLNLYLIPRWGTFGAGLGLMLSYVAAYVWAVWVCTIRNEILKIREGEKHQFDRKILIKAAKIGAPIIAKEVAVDGASIVTMGLLTPFGTVAVAADSLVAQATSICYEPAYGIGDAATGLVGRTAGSGDAGLARRYGNVSVMVGTLLVTALAVVMWAACPFVFKLMTPDMEVHSLAVQAARITFAVYPIYGALIVIESALAGVGDTMVSSAVEVVSSWAITVGLVFVLRGTLGVYSVWIAAAFSMVVRGAILLYRQKTSPYYERN